MFTKPISLIGMAGCGKTTIGKKLAAKYNFIFCDTDALIEKKFNMHLQDINLIAPLFLIMAVIQDAWGAEVWVVSTFSHPSSVDLGPSRRRSSSTTRAVALGHPRGLNI